MKHSPLVPQVSLSVFLIQKYFRLSISNFSVASSNHPLHARALRKELTSGNHTIRKNQSFHTSLEIIRKRS